MKFECPYRVILKFIGRGKAVDCFQVRVHIVVVELHNLHDDIIPIVELRGCVPLQ